MQKTHNLFILIFIQIYFESSKIKNISFQT